MRSGIYAGSFDVLTYGHIDIIKQANKMFDNLHIVVANNSSKKCIFTPKERVEMLWECRRQSFANEPCNWVPVKYDGLIADYKYFRPHDRHPLLVRGIRNVTDMISEMAMADLNEELGEVKTIFIPTSNEYRNFSSSLVKQLLEHGKDISKYVPPYVEKALREKYALAQRNKEESIQKV